MPQEKQDTQVPIEQIGRFLKVLGNILLFKSSPNILWRFGLFGKHSFLVKTAVYTFVQLLKMFGRFLIKTSDHTVSNLTSEKRSLYNVIIVSSRLISSQTDRIASFWVYNLDFNVSGCARLQDQRQHWRVVAHQGFESSGLQGRSERHHRCVIPKQGDRISALKYDRV